MQGLEISRRFWETYGRPMLEREFGELMPYFAVGLVGSGSERYGFDDAISRDHDFDPGFCIFLPGEETVTRRQEFLLERAYSRLPKEFEGLHRQMLSPVGGNRSGPMRTADFYEKQVGDPAGELDPEAWLRIPDYALAEAVNGEVFYDGLGEFTAIREKLLHMPEDIRRKRLAGNILLMGQAGQYNFSRCLRHGEPEAAQLALHEFTVSAMKVWFLLNRSYMPYYKWSFRAMRVLPGGTELAQELSFLLRGEGDREKSERIETIAGKIGKAAEEQKLCKNAPGELERLAYAVNNEIEDGNIRNLHILAGI